MHGAGEGLFFRWCEEYPAVQSECAAHELCRIQSELGSIFSWVSIELKGCTWKIMEGVYMENIFGRRWMWTIVPRSFGIFWIGGMGDSLIYSRSRYFCGTWSSKHQSLACMIWDLGLGKATRRCSRLPRVMIPCLKAPHPLGTFIVKVLLGHTYLYKLETYGDHDFIDESSHVSFRNPCSVHPILFTWICILSSTLCFTVFFEPPPPSRTSVPTNAPCVLEKS